MKRSARTALDEERHSVVYDAVQLVQSEQPAALDKLVQYTFFNATDALLDVLKKRPLLLLNLIQVNKAMYAFWNRVNGLWVVLADSLMASVAEDDAWVHVYAFYVLQARRERARLSELHRTLEWNELGASDISDRLKAKIDNGARRYRVGSDHPALRSVDDLPALHQPRSARPAAPRCQYCIQAMDLR